jgi:hypothetical protein
MPATLHPARSQASSRIRPAAIGVLARSAWLAALLSIFSADAHAVPAFGATARGSELGASSQEDGGPGSATASVSGPTYQTEAALGGPTFTPILKASSVSENAENTDDFTTSVAQAFQTFTSSITQTITLDILLHGVVTNVGTPLSNSYVLADVKVIGGSAFSLSDTFCSGQYAFGIYLCGSTLGTPANLYIPDGDLMRPGSITFDVSAGEQFAVYGILRANSRDGSADAFDTLQMSFQDDTYIIAIPEPGTLWLVLGGLLGMPGVLRRRPISR